MKIKYSYFFAFTTLLFFSLFGANAFSQSETLKVGTIERPPFMMKDGTGNLTGFSIELWREIALRLKVETEFREFSKFGDATEERS